jgi:hypothetical protein
MKYISSRVWITAERIMLVYLKAGNKRGIIRMKILVSEDHHSCLRCPYNPECKLTCYDLERMSGLQEKVKEEFGIGSSLLHITPLFIERLRAKSRPDGKG